MIDPLRPSGTSPKYPLATLGSIWGKKSSEQVNTNHLQRVQNIMFCMVWAFSCSLVHSGGFLMVFSGFGLFLVIQFIVILILSNEVVKNYEEHGDSMRQFAMELMNK